MESSLFIEIGIVIIGASVLSWVAVLGRQPVAMAYLICGVIVGPWGFALVRDIGFVDEVSEIGISLLLFLAGMELSPSRVKGVLGRIFTITLFTGVASTYIIFALARFLNYDFLDSLLIGGALAFSSTILTIKLIPSISHKSQHLGTICLAILMTQDVLAIIILMSIEGASQDNGLLEICLFPLKFIFILGGAVVFEQYVLRPAMRYCESVEETLYLFPLAWCLGMAMVGDALGFSKVIGAFLAGIILARSPLSQILVEKLKLLRDFFLLFFFFALGAKMNLVELPSLVSHVLLITVAVVLVKMFLFSSTTFILREEMKFSLEVGARLSHGSEFSIIIALSALETGLIKNETAQLIQLSAIMSFLLSAYVVSNIYKTPWTVSEKQIKKTSSSS